MIGSILIKLKPQGEIKIIGKGGETLYSLFLNILNRENKNLAKEIHDLKSEKPVTVSPFLKGTKFSNGYSVLSPNESVSFRITYLKEELLEPIIKGFISLSARNEPIKLSNGKILIEKVDMQKATHAGFTSFQEILSKAKNEETIVLEFCSPTSFRSQGEQKLFPLPELVFSSLLKKWDAFSGKKLLSEIAEIEKEFGKIRVTRFRLKTELLNFSKYKIIGFIGKVVYELPETIDKEIKKIINALADFAFYSGVGYKTTMGMGQARRV
ncbi:MAG: CRISPR-associated endoribonuclease Cas6 [Candidatus Aminicenantia bacterium]